MMEWMNKTSNGLETLLDIGKIKSRILEIESNRLKHLGSNMEEVNLLKGEMMNIYQVSAQIKRIDSCRMMKLSDGTHIITDLNILKQKVFDYYTATFSADATPVERTSLSDDPINYIDKSLNDDERNELIRPISEQEIKTVLECCSHKKTPGPDGLNYEFYLTHYDSFKFDLVETFNNYFNGTRRPPSSFTDGIITLIPKKGGNSLSLDDYRPISLLNCDYKLFTKIIPKRIENVLSKLIGKGQTACVGNMSCVDNLKDLRRILTKSCETKSFKGCLVSLDLNKAFDRVDHTYLWKVLEKFGFPSQLIDCLKVLYKNAKSRILINGFLTSEININCSVRQGCPLSMILFVLYIASFEEDIDFHFRCPCI